MTRQDAEKMRPLPIKRAAVFYFFVLQGENMKPEGFNGATSSLHNGPDSSPALIADRIAGQWLAEQQGGGREYHLNPIREELLRYHNDAPIVGATVLAGEVIHA